MTSAQFTAASSYVELAPRLLVHSGVTEEVIRMTVTTTSADGILLWQDQVLPTSSRGGRRDFIALALENGYLVFRSAEKSFCSSFISFLLLFIVNLIIIVIINYCYD